jgi:hypothetical protein
MFTENFEKKASLGDVAKAVGKSGIEAAKGVGSGLKHIGKESLSKMEKEWPKAKAGWKGFKDPSSYKAAAEFATKMSPEIAGAGAVGYGLKKVLDPNEQKGATLAYY